MDKIKQTQSCDSLFAKITSPWEMQNLVTACYEALSVAADVTGDEESRALCARTYHHYRLTQAMPPLTGDWPLVVGKCRELFVKWIHGDQQNPQVLLAQTLRELMVCWPVSNA